MLHIIPQLQVNSASQQLSQKSASWIRKLPLLSLISLLVLIGTSHQSAASDYEIHQDNVISQGRSHREIETLYDTYVLTSRIEEGITEFEALLITQPENVYLYAYLSALYHIAYQTELASQTLETALKLDPTNGIVYWAQAVLSDGLIIRDTESGLYYVDLAIRAMPDFSRAYTLQCFFLLLEDRLTEADQSCEEALRLDPKASNGYRYRGYIYDARGEFDLALQDMNYAIELSPDNYAAYDGLGYVLFNMERYSESIVAYTRSIALFPRPASYSNRGHTYLTAGDNARAELDFREAVSLAPQYTHAWINLGWFYWDINRPQDAKNVFEEAILAVPTFAAFYEVLGYMYSQEGNHPVAVGYYCQYMALQTTVADDVITYVNAHGGCQSVMSDIST
jgi:tetratricopeptide (TPR) repeat protein